MAIDVLITGATVITAPDAPPIPDGFVAIAGERIAACGPATAMPPIGEGAERISLPGHVLLPGLINIHTHAVLSLMRGIAVDMGFAPAYTRGVPHGHEIGPEEAVALARLGALEALLAGSTVMVDSYVHADLTLPAMAALGGRIWSCGRVHDVDFSRVHLADWRYDDATGEATLAATRRLITDHHGSCGGRANVMLIPHAPDTCSDALLAKVADLARETGLIVSTHLSQSKAENAVIAKRSGCTPTELLDRLGLLEGLIAAHCIHMTRDDIARFGAAGATVAHVPKGNATGGAVADTPALRSAGGTIALATDNLTQDMAEAMRWALATARVRLGEVAADWQPEDALAMATTNGAKALRMADTLGRIAPGYAADLVAFDMARAHLTPLLDPLGTIVHDANGRDVANVWVAGRQVVRDGAPTLADAAAIRREAQAAAEALWARAGQDDPPEHATATARGG